MCRRSPYFRTFGLPLLHSRRPVEYFKQSGSKGGFSVGAIGLELSLHRSCYTRSLFESPPLPRMLMVKMCDDIKIPVPTGPSESMELGGRLSARPGPSQSRLWWQAFSAFAGQGAKAATMQPPVISEQFDSHHPQPCLQMPFEGSPTLSPNVSLMRVVGETCPCQTHVAEPVKRRPCRLDVRPFGNIAFGATVVWSLHSNASHSGSSIAELIRPNLAP